ncbi:MAG: AEC family transporter [Tistlia sp.]|uniref:AEC family transporter n=1 Tax=Tistlia sp. TaxID=3057121 RepID=UPI0034A2692E
MESVVNVVLPVFAIMAAGYAAGRLKLLGPASSQALNGFVFWCALPALFFGSMAQVPTSEIFNFPYLIAYGGSALATFALALAVAAFAFPNRFGGLSMHALSAIFSNTGYMGIPLLQIAFGAEGTLPGVIATVVNGAVVIGLGIVLLESDRPGASWQHILRDTLLGLVKSPLIVSAIAGLLWSTTGLGLAEPVIAFTALLGAAAGPCALFAMGLFMVGKSFTAGLGEVGWVTFLKLLVMPAIAFWLAFDLLEMPRIWALSAVIMAALPTGALMFVLAQEYGIYIQRSVAVILISTVASVVTLSALFIWLGMG